MKIPESILQEMFLVLSEAIDKYEVFADLGVDDDAMWYDELYETPAGEAEPLKDIIMDLETRLYDLYSFFKDIINANNIETSADCAENTSS